MGGLVVDPHAVATSNSLDSEGTRMRKFHRALGVGLVLALTLAACGGDDAETTDPGTETDVDDTDETEETDDEAAEPASAGGTFTAYGCEPQSLVPQDSREVCGGRVVLQVFSGLVETDEVSGEPELLVAESIETEDSIVWDIEIRDDFTFHDGTPVTVDSFVDAWNFGANPDNGQRAVGFYQEIEGFEALQEGEADTLSGVEITGDNTIQITLSDPFAPFLTKLSDSAFYPLPDVAYDDIDAFNQEPIGNGRYQMAGPWENDIQIPLARYEDWPGDDPGLADEITYTIYDSVETAYLDVQAGSLDVLEQIPPERLAAAEGDFGDNVVQTDTSSFTYLGFPMYDPVFGENQELRYALSMAIDREAIISAIFNDAQTAATGVIPPVLDAYRGDACGELCEFDPERAQELFEEAGGYDGTMTVYFNSGAGHEEWVEAVTNQWREVLGIEEFEFESLEFAQYLDILADEGAVGPYRLGWALAYLSPEYAMADLYTTTGDSNYFGYGNSEFDDTLAEANASDPEDADAVYQQAEDILLEDLPLIPMWYGQSTSVHTDRVSNIVVDATTYLRVEKVEVTD
jgi:oligopeptide transport system substrate-binding protein